MSTDSNELQITVCEILLIEVLNGLNDYLKGADLDIVN